MAKYIPIQIRVPGGLSSIDDLGLTPSETLLLIRRATRELARWNRMVKTCKGDVQRARQEMAKYYDKRIRG